MTKEKLLSDLADSMKNEAIDLEWVQEKVLRELEQNLTVLCDQCSGNCGGSLDQVTRGFAVM